MSALFGPIIIIIIIIITMVVIIIIIKTCCNLRGQKCYYERSRENSKI
jgi:hypothetical protein